MGDDSPSFVEVCDGLSKVCSSLEVGGQRFRALEALHVGFLGGVRSESVLEVGALGVLGEVVGLGRAPFV